MNDNTIALTPGDILSENREFSEEVMFLCDTFAKLMRCSKVCFGDHGQPIFIGIDEKVDTLCLRIPLCSVEKFEKRKNER